MNLKKLALTVFVFLLFQSSSAFAWRTETTAVSGGQFILETFYDFDGKATDVRPGGKQHAQIAVVCTNGFFEVDLFEIGYGGDLKVLGNIKNVSFQSGSGKGRYIAASQMNGSNTVRITDPKKLHGWMLDQKRIQVTFLKGDGSRYTAYFDISNLRKYSKNFNAAKCNL